MKLNPVPARTGVLWVRQGIRTFMRQPLALAGLFLLYMLALSLLSTLPLIGNPLALALLPAVTLGLMVATREADRGKFPLPTLILSAFRAGRERARAMLVLGAAYALGFMVVLGISALFDGGQFAQVYLGSAEMTEEIVLSDSSQRAMWIGMLCYLPLAMLFWHAPALVYWCNKSPAESLFYSLLGQQGRTGLVHGRLDGGVHAGRAAAVAAGRTVRQPADADLAAVRRRADASRDVLQQLLLHLPRQLHRG